MADSRIISEDTITIYKKVLRTAEKTGLMYFPAASADNVAVPEIPKETAGAQGTGACGAGAQKAGH